MNDYGDRDGDGFLEYACNSPKGLVQQGWKDSLDSVFHRDGTFAQGPIALCEVQGYAYAAKLAGAAIASSLGEATRSKALSEQAEILKENFQKSFWCEEISIYALALDGEKRQCGIRTSNAGHCLYAGIAGPEQARRVANTLMAAQSFSGWGVRTVATSEARFNPMSYHNGSIWPHEHALIAAGICRYSAKVSATQSIRDLLHEDVFAEYLTHDVFCGVERP